jgi:hypothetical protein
MLSGSGEEKQKLVLRITMLDPVRFVAYGYEFVLPKGHRVELNVCCRLSTTVTLHWMLFQHEYFFENGSVHDGRLNCGSRSRRCLRDKADVKIGRLLSRCLTKAAMLGGTLAWAATFGVDLIACAAPSLLAVGQLGHAGGRGRGCYIGAVWLHGFFGRGEVTA